MIRVLAQPERHRRADSICEYLRCPKSENRGGSLSVVHKRSLPVADGHHNSFLLLGGGTSLWLQASLRPDSTRLYSGKGPSGIFCLTSRNAEQYPLQYGKAVFFSNRTTVMFESVSAVDYTATFSGSRKRLRSRTPAQGPPKQQDRRIIRGQWPRSLHPVVCVVESFQ
jgi:hypothetical protein